MKNKKDRIAKFIAQRSGFSRREIEAMIKQSRITVNDIEIDTPVCFVSSADQIAIDGNKIEFKDNIKTEVWCFYKPVDILCSNNGDGGKKTIYDILPKNMHHLKYIGRLDYKSEGLLLLTNNGYLINNITNPKARVSRKYLVKVFGYITQEKLDSLAFGITVDRVKYRPILADIKTQHGKQVWINFELTEGKNNEIRNICAHLGLTVRRLIRTHFHAIHIGELNSAGFYKLTNNELNVLKEFL